MRHSRGSVSQRRHDPRLGKRLGGITPDWFKLILAAFVKTLAVNEELMKAHAREKRNKKFINSVLNKP